MDPKTHDGADFLRALKKHRELQNLELLEAAKSKAQHAEEVFPETSENENQGGDGEGVRLHASEDILEESQEWVDFRR